MKGINRFSLFLLPSIFQGAVSLATLPVATYILDPADYGIYALAISFTAFGTALATFGSSAVLAAHFPVVDFHEKARLISTLLSIGILLFLVFALLFVLVWESVIPLWSTFEQVPRTAVYLALLAAGLSFPWVVAVDVVSLEGKAGVFATTVIGQSLMSALALIVSLYLFDLGLLSLFVSSLVSSVACLVGATLFLRRYLCRKPTGTWVRAVVRVGIPMTLSHVLETVHTLVERTLLSTYSGYTQVGVFTHSQQYRGIAGTGVKAVARTVWPRSLEEARAGEDFTKTGVAWDVVYVGLTALGIFFATLGQDFISLLSHDKFTSAHVLASLWMVFLLVQNAGKPHNAFLFASGKGHEVAKLLNFAIIFGIVLLVVLVPKFGVYGAVVAAFALYTSFRIGVQVLVRKAGLPNQDRWVLVGISLILTVLSAKLVLQPEVVGRVTLMALGLMILVLMSRKRIEMALSYVLRPQETTAP